MQEQLNMQRTGKFIIASLMMFMPATTNAGNYDFLEKGINDIKVQAALPSGTAVLALKDGKVTKSFFQHQPSQLFPAGSTFNPLISTTEKEGNRD